jgi:Spy/CpxP family protein refolding chaperone
MKLARTLALLSTLALVPASVVACGGSVEAPPQTSASAATKAPVGASTHGIVKIVGEALGEVPLRADQRTELEKLATEADARHAATADGRKALMATIADQIEKGSIDRAALQPKIDRLVADMEKVRPGDQAALARVHAILDPQQRNAFVDALEKQMHERHGVHAKVDGARKGFGHVKQLADDLELTDEQRTKIREVMMEGRKEWGHEGGPHHRGGHDAKARLHGGKKALEAFRSDKFDPAAAGPQGDMKERAAEGTTHMIGVAEKILPILTPEQRKIAADKVRAMSASGEMPFGH